MDGAHVAVTGSVVRDPGSGGDPLGSELIRTIGADPCDVLAPFWSFVARGLQAPRVFGPLIPDPEIADLDVYALSAVQYGQTTAAATNPDPGRRIPTRVSVTPRTQR